MIEEIQLLIHCIVDMESTALTHVGCKRQADAGASEVSHIQEKMPRDSSKRTVVRRTLNKSTKQGALTALNKKLYVVGFPSVDQGADSGLSRSFVLNVRLPLAPASACLLQPCE